MNRTADRPLLPAFLVIGAMAAMAVSLAGCGGPPVVDGGPLPQAVEPALPEASGPESALANAAAWMPGDYSSSAQSKEDATYFDVRLHIVPIWTDRTDGPWLYVEQAMADAQDKPYRQRIYRLASAPGDRVESIIFELPGNPLQWAGAWREPARLNALDPGILEARTGCTVSLAMDGASALRGATNGTDCGSGLRGAAYATSEVTLTATELNTWDRGFDAEGRQVWGAVKGPYRFVKEAPAPAEPPPPENPPGDEAAVAEPAPEAK